jgi:hypothetical protein
MRRRAAEANVNWRVAYTRDQYAKTVIIFFWSNEHEPIHVHGEYQGRESKAEIILEEGNIVRIDIVNVKGRRPLQGKRMTCL